MRLINIIGEISDESYKDFCEKLDVLEKKSNSPIEIRLSSGGGDAMTALAYVSRMRLSVCEFYVTGYGLVASAAVLILAFGDKRFMTSESWVMVHEGQWQLEGDVSTSERAVKQHRKFENQWQALMAKRTTLTAKEWAKLDAATTYLDANDCFKCGLIEEIL